MGTEFSLKTAVVSLFVEGLLDIDGDEKGKMVCVCVCVIMKLCVLVTPLFKLNFYNNNKKLI